MLKNPVARTRALYKWEREELDLMPGNFMFIAESHAQEKADSIWNEFAIRNEQCPRVHLVLNRKGLSYAHGRSDIYLTGGHHQATLVTLIHEIVHCLGYGSHRNPHSVGFVDCYLQILGTIYWDYTVLKNQAKMRGLL